MLVLAAGWTECVMVMRLAVCFGGRRFVSMSRGRGECLFDRHEVDHATAWVSTNMYIATHPYPQKSPF